MNYNCGINRQVISKQQYYEIRFTNIETKLKEALKLISQLEKKINDPQTRNTK